MSKPSVGLLSDENFLWERSCPSSLVTRFLPENEDGTSRNKIIQAQLLQTELLEWMIRTISWGYGENPCLGPLSVLASVSLHVSSLAPAPLTQLLLVFLLSSQDQLLTFIHWPPPAITGLNHFGALATFSFSLSFSLCCIFVFSVIRWDRSHALQVSFSQEGWWREIGGERGF